MTTKSIVPQGNSTVSTAETGLVASFDVYKSLEPDELAQVVAEQFVDICQAEIDETMTFGEFSGTETLRAPLNREQFEILANLPKNVRSSMLLMLKRRMKEKGWSVTFGHCRLNVQWPKCVEEGDEHWLGIGRQHSYHFLAITASTSKHTIIKSPTEVIASSRGHAVTTELQDRKQTARAELKKRSDAIIREILEACQTRLNRPEGIEQIDKGEPVTVLVPRAVLRQLCELQKFAALAECETSDPAPGLVVNLASSLETFPPAGARVLNHSWVKEAIAKATIPNMYIAHVMAGLLEALELSNWKATLNVSGSKKLGGSLFHTDPEGVKRYYWFTLEPIEAF